MARMSKNLETQCKDHPRTWVNLIVGISGDAGEHVQAMEKRGVQIQRRFRLTGKVGVKATGKMVLELAQAPWVTSIEEDKPVHAL